jgi:hypothetical protein
MIATASAVIQIVQRFSDFFSDSESDTLDPWPCDWREPRGAVRLA